MFISIEGPSASGKTIMANRLRDFYESENHFVVMLSNPKIELRQLRKIILPILHKERMGIVIADCLNTGNNYVFEIHGKILSPDVILRTMKDNSPSQGFIDKKTSLHDVLKCLPIIYKRYQ